MKKIHTILFFFSICFNCFPSIIYAQKLVISPTVISQIDSLFSTEFKSTEPGAVIMLSQGKNILLRKAYGMASMELGVPMSPDHVLAIGSITKQFTAVGILMLHDQEKLSIRDDIRK